ncbi:MAG: phage integrase SAM-like domain-containing protein [Bacteroidota bacterium]|nr:phage integrase SAM-like domain-containing protein [Bacteroidota bacterium]
MATFKGVILKGKNHVKSDGTTNLKIRITHNRKADYISTDLFVPVDKSKRGFTYGDNAKFIQGRLTTYINKYQKAYIELGDAADMMSVQELKLAVQDNKKTEINFINFADNYFLQLQKDGKEGSERAVRGFLSNLKKYTDRLMFSQIDSTFLKNFEKWMQDQGVKNGIPSYMARFRSIFNKGREQYNDDDRGIIRIANYPFTKYKIVQPLGTAKESCLTADQCRMLINHQPVLNRSKMAKDMFMLQFYLIGINSKDLFFMKKPVKGRLGFDRFKTERPYSIKLEPEALQIIEKYKGEKSLINMAGRYGYYLDFQKAINKGMKNICEDLHKQAAANKQKIDFPEKITSNWARHTWATIGRNDCKINKDDIALCLGHEDADNKVTDIYIRYDYSIIDEANRKVIDAVL